MSVVFKVIAPRLLGPAVMVAAAIIVKGYNDVGDGFSAGVVVSLAIALRYIVLGADRAEATLPVLRHAAPAAAAGLLLALAVGFAPLLRGDPPFTHYPAPGEAVVHFGTLEVISALVFDVGVFVLVTGALAALMHELAHLVDGERR